MQERKEIQSCSPIVTLVIDDLRKNTETGCLVFEMLNISFSISIRNVVDFSYEKYISKDFENIVLMRLRIMSLLISLRTISL